jgi:hypothetical protein
VFREWAALSVKSVSHIGMAVAVFFKQLREGAKPAVLMEKPVPTLPAYFVLPFLIKVENLTSTPDRRKKGLAWIHLAAKRSLLNVLRALILRP